MELGGAEAAHAFRVMRRRVGDRIELFDGIGNQCQAQILAIDRRSATCLADPAVRHVATAAVNLHLAVALPNGDRAREMIERLTELNVARITPLRFGRTQRAVKSAALEKLRRASLEACKQCGRNHLPKLDEEVTLQGFLKTHLPVADQTRLVATPGGTPLRFPTDKSLTIIGPEGGLSDDEQALVQSHGFEPVTLGPLILRIETAAAVVAAVAAVK